MSITESKNYMNLYEFLYSFCLLILSIEAIVNITSVNENLKIPKELTLKLEEFLWELLDVYCHFIYYNINEIMIWL